MKEKIHRLLMVTGGDESRMVNNTCLDVWGPAQNVVYCPVRNDPVQLLGIFNYPIFSLPWFTDNVYIIVIELMHEGFNK